MEISALIEVFRASRISISEAAGDLSVRGPKSSLADAAVLSALRENKALIIEHLRRGGEIDFAANVEGAGRPPLRRRPAGAERPLSFAQQRLWFLAQVEDAGRAYHIPIRLRLLGQLDAGALRTALDEIVDRHEILRTRIELRDGEPVQMVTPEGCGFALSTFDLAQPGPGNALDDHIQEEADKPFDLALDHPVRGRLIRLAADEHALLVTFHHIAADGWSMAIIMRELSELYGAARAGEPNGLERPAFQYAEFAAWQRDWLSGETLAGQQAYWRKTLDGAPDLLSLPLDRPRPTQQSFEGAFEPFRLGATATAKLIALSRAEGVTLYMALLTAWSIVLHRLSGQPEVVVGSPVAGRSSPELEPMVGLFINTLALRLDLGEAPTFREALARTKAAVLSAHEQQDLPFEQVIEAVRPPRSAAYSPICQVLFAWQNNEAPKLKLPGVSVLPIAGRHSVAKLDLTLNLGEVGGEIVGGVEYASALFDQATIVRHLAYLERVIEAMTRDPDQLHADAPLLSETERAVIIDEWNMTTPAPSPALAVHHQFQAQAATTPAAAAVVWQGGVVSYGELDQASDAIAQNLRRLGVAIDRPVALLMDRSPQLVAAVLGVLKVGGAYVPLDPSHPPERLREVLDDCGAAIIITDQAGDPGAGPASQRQVVVIDSLLHPPSQAEQLEGARADWGAQLAYVIYTSGSTGSPKGVMIEHGSLANYLSALGDVAPIGPGDTVAALTTVAFDIAVTELLYPLARGASIALIDVEHTRDGAAIAAALRQHRVTLLQATPTTWRMLASHDLGSDLKQSIVGGEALDAALAAVLVAKTPSSFNFYGPTEATVWSTYHRLSVDDADGPPPIGKPLANTSAYVLDPRGQPTPPGVVGEIHLGGEGLARGYWNRPDLTMERFLPSPFRPGERLYRTGDLGRFRPDGALEYVGRNDHQVKIRGFRVELAEIEARISSHPEIREAAVQLLSDADGGRLVAYYTVKRQDTPVGATALRGHIASHLPDYMLPAAYVLLDAMPLTANGKLDRRALPLPDDSSYPDKDMTEPEGETELMLAAIWQEILGVERVGRHDNFFDLGGHSLLVVRLLQALQTAGLEADVRTIFRAPTLAGLAHELRNQAQIAQAPAPAYEHDWRARLTPQERTAVIANSPLGEANVQDVYELTPLQEGLLFHHLLAETGDPYLNLTLLRFASREGLEAYVEALNAVVARHDALRTSIQYEGVRNPLQVVWRDRPVPLEEADLAGSTGDVAARLRKHYGPRKQRLDLQREPLTRVVAARDERNDGWVAAVLSHHICADGVSSQIISDEISRKLRKDSKALPPPTPFRAHLATRHEVDRSSEQEAFFGRLLGDLEHPTVAFGLENARLDGAEAGDCSLVIPAPLAADIRRRARETSTTPASLFHVAWGLVLAAGAGKDDVTFGSVFVGRTRHAAAAAPAIGLCMNTLPVRLRFGEASAASVLRAAHGQLVDLLDYEDASLTLAHGCSRIARGRPLVTALLNYRTAPTEPQNGEGTHFDWLSREERTNFPLAMFVDDFGDRFVITAQSQAPLAADTLCELMLKALGHASRVLTEAPIMSGLDLIDRRPAYPEPSVAHPNAPTPGARPADPALLSKVAGVWAAVLGVASPASSDNFFELGGHSLLALRAVSALQSEGLPCDLRMLVGSNDLADLCSVIEHARSDPKAA